MTLAATQTQRVVRPSDFYRMPNEMWISVFEALSRPSELLKVVLTCKHFFSLAIRVLYRDLYWTGPFLYAENSRFWMKQEASLAEIPRSLTVAVSLMPPNAFGRFDPGTALVEPDGSWRVAASVAPHAIPAHDFSPRSDLRRRTFYASSAMYQSITNRISSFSMLRELLFHMAELPDTIYSTIKALPRLRYLSIGYCTLPLVYSEPDLTLFDLPITELTFWSNKGDSDAVPNSSYVYALYLCTARHLRTLRVDWNGVTARFFCLRSPDAPAITLPVDVTDLTLRFPQTKVWPTEDDDDHISNTPFSPLSRFLSALPAIKTFTIVNRRTHLDLPVTAMPHLTKFVGPMITVASIIQNRPVDHLEITDMDKRTADHLLSLPLVAHSRPKLQTLSLLIREWDDEILFALTSLFEDLRVIKIWYNFGFPSEQTLISLGAQFLYRFPRLHTLRIHQTTSNPGPASSPHRPVLPVPLLLPFVQRSTSTTRHAQANTQGPGAKDDDEEVRELIVPWRKHCPCLREVQFVEGYVWRRAFDGDLWCKREVVGSGLNKEGYLM